MSTTDSTTDRQHVCPTCGHRRSRKGSPVEVTVNGVTYYTIRQACAALGVPLSRVNDRIYRGGWPLERALTTPLLKRVRPPAGATKLGHEAALAKRQLEHGRAVLDAWRRRSGMAA